MRLPRPHLFLIQTTMSIIVLLAPSATAQEIANLEHDLSQGNNNSLVQVDADTFALAYQGAGQDGTLKTFTISANGATITAVESVVYETDATWDNSIIQLDSDTFVIAYSAAGDDGFITTFTISPDGTSITEVTSLEHDTSNGYSNSLVQVDGDTFAVAFGGINTPGIVKIFAIPADGTSITEVDSLEHDAINGRNNSLVQVDADTFALAYSGEDSHGHMKIFTISGGGTTITEAVSLEHDSIMGRDNSLAFVNAPVFTLAYEGNGNDGFIKTFDLSAMFVDGFESGDTTAW